MRFRTVMSGNQTSVMFLDRIIALGIILTPILSYYKSPILFSSVGTIMSMIIGILCVIRILLARRFELKKSAVILTGAFMWFVLITLLSIMTEYGRNYSSFNSLISFSVTIISIILYTSICDISAASLKRIYKFVCIIVIILYVIQYIAYYLFNTAIVMSIPFLTPDDSYLVSHDFGVSLSTRGLAQFSCLFSEKSHLCQFILPCLVILLCEKKNIGRMLMAVAVTLLLMSTASGIGIVCCVAVWLYYLFVVSKGISLPKKFLLVILVAVMFLIIHSILMGVPIYKNSVENLFVASDRGSSKADYRVYRGFNAYFSLGTVAKILGVGYRQMSSYLLFNGNTEIFVAGETNTEYLNAVAQTVVFFGIIGLILLVFYYAELFKRSNRTGKGILIIFVAIAFGASVLFDRTNYLYISLILAYAKETSALPDNSCNAFDLQSNR